MSASTPSRQVRRERVGRWAGVVYRAESNVQFEAASARLSLQKDRALDGVGGVTEAIRQSTESLREQHDTIARYVEQVVGQIDRATENLRQKDVGQLIDDAQRLARRQPALFLGSAFAIGLLGARFLKSSPPGAQQAESDYGGQRGHTPVWRAQD
jgi:hypothetical protein